MKLKKIFIISNIMTALAFLLLLNYYLISKELLFYSPYSEKKAFFNSKWGMSPKEIEKENKVNLTPAKIVLFNIPDQGGFKYPSVVNMERYKLLNQIEHFTLWGFETKVEYSFFDNKLFEYTLFITGYDSTELHITIVTALKRQFGEGIIENKDYYLHSIKWENKINSVSYWNWMGKEYDQNLYLYHAGIRIRYNPLINKIRKISIKEEKRIF